jgi:hypothetical protein
MFEHFGRGGRNRGTDYRQASCCGKDRAGGILMRRLFDQPPLPCRLLLHDLLHAFRLVECGLVLLEQLRRGSPV